MVKTYNINELLERKKELEEQLVETSNFQQTDLVYEKQKIVDVTNKGNNREIETRKQISLNDFTMKYNGLLNELSKIKIAIAKFNAENTSELLYKRESARNRIEYLRKIKSNLKKDKQEGRKVTRQNNEGETLEFVDFEIRPMFTIEEVEKQFNETAAEERKLNTQIQKINLDAKISLE